MTEQAQPVPTRSAIGFVHVPHPRIRQRKSEGTVRTDDERVGLNGRIGLHITAVVGTMWAAYLFAVIGFTGIVAALTGSVFLVLLVGAVSGYFLQLVLLPVIIVGQNLQSMAADKRSEQTFKDAEAILHECLQLQAHLQAQDQVLNDLISGARAGSAPA